MAKLQVLVKQVRKDPKVQEVDAENALKELQAIVGGYIESVPSRVPTKGAHRAINVLSDEEGRMKGYKSNFEIPFVLGDIRGDAVFVIQNYEEGEWESLTAEDVNQICAFYNWKKPLEKEIK